MIRRVRSRKSGDATPRRHAPDAGVMTRTVEMAVAAGLFALGLLVAYDSHRVGIGWAAEGPQAGYFPFYVGLFLCLAAAWILLRAFFAGHDNDVRFVSNAQLKMVLAVLVPSILFVAAIYVVGIYVAAGLYIGGFMRWQGRYRPAVLLVVSVAVPLFLFFMFEVWFLVPLPKGPVESLFGY